MRYLHYFKEYATLTLVIIFNYIVMKYEWNLSETNFTKDKWTVFSCFACGWWSTMWYKLAWFDVIWCNEIDLRMNACYIKNHNPKFNYLEDIRIFKERQDLPKELYNLDILDGSPPCSSFSIAWNREKDWGKEKKFREWQELQILDTLFFDFIDLGKKLQPKIVIAENVKGLMIWNAQDYMNKIIIAFNEAWYKVDYKLLNWASMWVPQRRERVFFYAIRNDLVNKVGTIDLFWDLPKLNLEFNQKKITYKEIESPYREEKWYHIPEWVLPYWEKIQPWRSCSDVHPKWHFFQELKLSPDEVLPTLRAGSNSYYHYKDKRRLFDEEILKWWSFPLDYDLNWSKAIYIVGMSVPPLMTYWIANEVYKQWICNL